MVKKCFLILVALLVPLLFINSSYAYAQGSYSFDLVENVYDTESDVREFISYCGGNRSPGSKGEELAIEYITNKLQTYGYEAFYEDGYIDEFEFIYGFSSKITGYNVAGIKRNNSSDKYVIIGAHYDTVNGNGDFEGVYDNASGVIAMLNIAKNVYPLSLPYNIVFVSFGAEEYGLIGSQYFVQTMNIESENILLYINLDSIGCGDEMYIYTDEVSTIHEDYIYSLAKQYSQNFEKESINLPPDIKNVNYSYGYGAYDYNHMGLSSDNVSFLSQGINSVFFFSGKWKNGTIGIQESSVNDNIYHTTGDNIENVLVKYPQFPNRIALVCDVVTNMLIQDTFVATMEESYNNKSSYMFFVNKTYPMIFLCVVGVIGLIVINLTKKKNITMSSRDNMQYEKLKEAVLNNTLDKYKQENKDDIYKPKLDD